MLLLILLLLLLLDLVRLSDRTCKRFASCVTCCCCSKSHMNDQHLLVPVTQLSVWFNVLSAPCICIGDMTAPAVLSHLLQRNAQMLQLNRKDLHYPPKLFSSGWQLCQL